MELQKISRDTLEDKYLNGDEKTAEDGFRRVAQALSEPEKNSEQQEKAFFRTLQDGFIPAGRICSAAGLGIKATLINCFTQPVGDAMIGTDHCGRPAIMPAQQQAGETMRRGGGEGYNFSHIRPKGAKVFGTNSQASGPLSFMLMFDTMCKTVSSAGGRRGAQMAVLNCDHPDIEAFIDAKARPYEEKDYKQFNFSLGATDALMQAVEDDLTWDLVHEAEPGDDLIANGAYQRDDGKWVYKTIQAKDLWEQVMRATYDFADPGVLNLDIINRENNLGYCEVIEATNPLNECGLPLKRGMENLL